MRENAAANMAGARQALNYVAVHPRRILGILHTVVRSATLMTPCAMDLSAITAAMVIIRIMIIIGVLGINTATKGEGWEC